MPSYRRGSPVRAEDLNRTQRAAETARLAGAAYLSQDNGDNLVGRDPRRFSRRIARSLSAPGMQWRITAKRGEGGSVAVRVAGGLVAWGGCITYSHPGADLGEFAPGSYARIVCSVPPAVPWTSTATRSKLPS